MEENGHLHAMAPNDVALLHVQDCSGKQKLPCTDPAAFAREIGELGRVLRADVNAADFAHLKKMQRWGRLSTLVGLALATIAVNPLAIFLLSLGNVARWSQIAHYVMHRGYDRVPNLPKHYHSKHFARGWRRCIDWLDWMDSAAWAHEHNHLHHHHTGEIHDPDLVEDHARITRSSNLPRPIKWVLLLFLMCTWKLSYYAPNTLYALQSKRRGEIGAPGVCPRMIFPGEGLWLPTSRASLEFYLRCVLPYPLLRFGLIPALFLPFGSAVYFAVLINLLLAELLANVHSFLIIAPNHAGEDLYRYGQTQSGREDYFLRQVLGSCNYPGGSDLADFCQGYLNYQIEHHLWPDLPMLKYRQAAPKVRAICARYGVPYVEQSVWRRFAKLWRILDGSASMRRA